MSSHVNRPLIMAVDGPKSELSGIATARRQELYYQKFPRRVAGGRVMQATRGSGVDPSVEDIATLLFLESFVPAKMVGRTTSITNLISSSGFSHAVNTTGDRARVYRAIAAAWFDSRNDPFEMYQIITLARSMGLSEHGCRIGIRLLTEPGVIGALSRPGREQSRPDRQPGSYSTTGARAGRYDRGVHHSKPQSDWAGSTRSKRMTCRCGTWRWRPRSFWPGRISRTMASLMPTPPVVLLLAIPIPTADITSPPINARRCMTNGRNGGRLARTSEKDGW